MSVERPNHLPIYTDPPLNEVVLGVQFAPVPGYSSINAKGIWDLFHLDFPAVQEHPLLPPIFETFGGTNLQPSFQFEIGGPPIGSRLWLIASDDDHLIQFQPDRFLANWRKRLASQKYPHFEEIASAFERNLSILEGYFLEQFRYEISINQAEISYINMIPVEHFSDASQWFSFWSGIDSGIESININFGDVIKGEHGQPTARLHHEIQSVFAVDGRHKAFRLSLTLRGRPSGSDVRSSLDFLASGREAIVERFTHITTPRAHEFWGRKS